MTRRPESLFFFKSQQWGDDTLIEAVFVDCDQPILFRARLPFEQRDFYADVFSTNEGSAEFFTPEELLEACFLQGFLEPEFTGRQGWHSEPKYKEYNDETRAAMNKCTEPADTNDGV